jgi:magnesium transporter
MIVNCVAYDRGQKLSTFRSLRCDRTWPGAVLCPSARIQPAELAALQEEFGLHELAIEDAQFGHQRPKIEEYGSSLFIVLHLIEPAGDELQTGEVAIFVGPQYIISVRRGAQVGFVDVRRRCEQEPELLQHGPAYVLYALMDSVVDRYFPVLDRLSAEIEGIEERIFAGQTTRAQIEALYSLKRKLMTLDHATQPLLEVTGKLHGGRVPPICAGLQGFRDGRSPDSP